LLFLKQNISKFKKPGLLFLHIPKAAGTSFRIAAERNAWCWKVYSDYGDDPGTSRLIKKCRKLKEYSSIENLVNKRTILAGHFSIRRYGRYYPLENIVSFVRDPIQRLLSHYHYMIRTDRYDGNLETFVEDPSFQNVQSKIFGKCPIEAVGFIGLTEKYNESLELIDKVYALRVPVKLLNRNKEKRKAPYDVEQELIDLIILHNQADIDLYEKVSRLFILRKKIEQSGIEYVYQKLDVIKNNEISGWAINPKISEPVKLDVILNGNIITQLYADIKRTDFNKINVHRNAEVGFRYLHNSRLEPSDNIEIRVVGSSQIISG